MPSPILGRSGSAWITNQITLSRCGQRLFTLGVPCNQWRQKSLEEPRRFARPNEVNYALRQDMGKGYTRKTVQLSAFGTTYDMVYGEWVPTERPAERCPAVVCIHGTPATDGAYRPIGSRIASCGYRVLAVNFPGMGYTQNDPERRYDYTTSAKVELVKGFIKVLELKRVAMVIGHSSGSHVVGGLAADPVLEGIVQSACFLCGSGVKPHRLYRRMNMPILAQLIFKLMYLPLIGRIVRYVCDQMMQNLGFRGKTREAQALSFYELAQMNFDTFHHDLLRISERRLPVLLFYSLDDAVVEWECLQENINVLQIPEADIKDYDANGQSEHTFQDGTLRRVVRFAAGTHRLHFTNPEKTSAEIISFLDSLEKR